MLSNFDPSIGNFSYDMANYIYCTYITTANGVILTVLIGICALSLGVGTCCGICLGFLTFSVGVLLSGAIGFCLWYLWYDICTFSFVETYITLCIL